MAQIGEAIKVDKDYNPVTPKITSEKIQINEAFGKKPKTTSITHPTDL